MNELEYNAKLSLLRERDPDHALLPLIEIKFGIVECAYLDEAIKTLPPVSPKKKVIDTTGNPTFDKLNDDLRKEFTERAKWSNKLHKTPHVSDRKEIIKHILSHQSTIERLMITKDHYEEHGEMPLDVNPFDLPKDSIELRKKEQTAMQMISRYKREIRQLSGDLAKNGDKIQQKESKLRHKEIKLNHIRDAIAKGL